MKLTQIEVSLSKEERRIVDEYGNSASTWARIGITAELEEGDLPDMCIKQLKGEIQPQVDEWLLNQGGYVTPLDTSIPEIQESMAELLDVPVIVSEVTETDAAEEDEIPL